MGNDGTRLYRENDLELLEADTKGIIEQFYYGVPRALKALREHLPNYSKPQLLREDLAHSDQSTECINRIQTVIVDYRDELMRAATANIVAYLGRYKVKSTSADQFKLAFWFGCALAEMVGRTEDLDKKAVFVLTCSVLDLFCDTHCGKRMAGDLRSKLDIAIAQGKNFEDFGLIGIYFSFKTLSKST